VALALLAVGLIQRDGVFVALGGAITVGWLVFLLVLAATGALSMAWLVQLFSR
jgi:hypothetical protein